MDDIVESQFLRTAAYFAVALACAWVSWRWCRDDNYANGWVFWAGAASLLLSFGLLKVGGVEQVVQETGREIADRGGIYEVRRGYQAVIIFVIVWSGLLWLLGFVIALRQQMLGKLFPGLIAVTTLACYVFARGVSHHDLDTVLYHRSTLGIQHSALIEVLLLGLLLAVAVQAGRAARSQQPPQHPPGIWLDGLRLPSLRP
jgi:hypothetical protein